VSTGHAHFSGRTVPPATSGTRCLPRSWCSMHPGGGSTFPRAIERRRLRARDSNPSIASGSCIRTGHRTGRRQSSWNGDRLFFCRLLPSRGRETPAALSGSALEWAASRRVARSLTRFGSLLSHGSTNYERAAERNLCRIKIEKERWYPGCLGGSQRSNS